MSLVSWGSTSCTLAGNCQCAGEALRDSDSCYSASSMNGAISFGDRSGDGLNLKVKAFNACSNLEEQVDQSRKDKPGLGVRISGFGLLALSLLDNKDRTSYTLSETTSHDNDTTLMLSGMPQLLWQVSFPIAAMACMHQRK